MMTYQVRWYRVDDSQRNAKGILQIPPNSRARIGREIGNDILLTDNTVSRLHAEVYTDADGVYVVDSGSHNGTRLDGQMIVRSTWRPGQRLAIGPFLLELSIVDEIPLGQGALPVASSPGLDSRIDPAHLPRVAGTSEGGRIKLSDVYRRAKANDPSAVSELFAGFLSRGEQVVDCGYLGALGYIFPEHSFWCVTPSRACGMMINASGRVDFTFGFLKALDIAYFHQPSLVKLWITIAGWCIFVGLLAMSVHEYITDLLGYNFWIGIVFGVVILVIGFLLIPWVIRVYYRFAKSGCVFFTKEHIPIFIFSDRQSLKDAQRFINVYAEQKRAAG